MSDGGGSSPGEGASIRGSTVGGKYRIGRPLGRGGMGRVFEAEDTELGRKVAIKILREDLAGDETFVERFRREARAAAAIGHPNIVHVYEIGRMEGGQPFIAMEALEGLDLRKELEESAPLSISRAVSITGQVLFGLSAAHRAGVVHRDLKPSNVFLVRGEAASFSDLEASRERTAQRETAKILDFGISRVTGSGSAKQITSAGTVLGTFRYMAPEQLVDSSAVDGRTDLYSVGVILFEALTARSPFGGDEVEAAMRRALAPTVPSVLEARADLPRGLAEVVARALAQDPAERFQSADEFIAALVPFHRRADASDWTGEHRLPVDEDPTEVGSPGALADLDTAEMPAPTTRSGADAAPAVSALTVDARESPDGTGGADTEAPTLVRRGPEAPAGAATPTPESEGTRRRARWSGLALALGFLVAASLGAALLIHARDRGEGPMRPDEAPARPTPLAPAGTVPVPRVLDAGAPTQEAGPVGAPGDTGVDAARGSSGDAAEPPEDDPLAAARACLERGDRACCLRALEEAPPSPASRRLLRACRRRVRRPVPPGASDEEDLTVEAETEPVAEGHEGRSEGAAPPPPDPPEDAPPDSPVAREAPW